MHPLKPFTAMFLAIMFLIPNAPPALELKAGVAKATITPPLDPPLIGVMGKPMTGVIHDIYARALTVYDGERRIAIVTYDLNCLDVATPILRERCRDELGIEHRLSYPARYAQPRRAHPNSAGQLCLWPPAC